MPLSHQFCPAAGVVSTPASRASTVFTMARVIVRSTPKYSSVTPLNSSREATKLISSLAQWFRVSMKSLELSTIFTADFRLTYADGTVEIVEIKSKFVRRMQRDYPVRRRVFLELIARPAGWKFTEIITAEDKEEIKRWRELAEEVSSCGKNG